jgi:hypothetical protein
MCRYGRAEMAVELRNRFHSMLDKAIPANLVFDHPTAGALTAYLASMVPGSKVAASAER